MASGQTILIIENNPRISSRLAELLYDLLDVESILTAADFEKAFNILSITRVDIVLLGNHLSDIEILELVSICNHDQHFSVIILSNHPHNFYKEKYRSLGLTHWIDKSNDFDLIAGLVDQISNSQKSNSIQGL